MLISCTAIGIPAPKNHHLIVCRQTALDGEMTGKDWEDAAELAVVTKLCQNWSEIV